MLTCLPPPQDTASAGLFMQTLRVLLRSPQLRSRAPRYFLGEAPDTALDAGGGGGARHGVPTRQMPLLERVRVMLLPSLTGADDPKARLINGMRELQRLEAQQRRIALRETRLREGLSTAPFSTGLGAAASLTAQVGEGLSTAASLTAASLGRQSSEGDRAEIRGDQGRASLGRQSSEASEDAEPSEASSQRSAARIDPPAGLDGLDGGGSGGGGGGGGGGGAGGGGGGGVGGGGGGGGGRGGSGGEVPLLVRVPNPQHLLGGHGVDLSRHLVEVGSKAVDVDGHGSSKADPPGAQHASTPAQAAEAAEAVLFEGSELPPPPMISDDLIPISPISPTLRCSSKALSSRPSSAAHSVASHRARCSTAAAASAGYVRCSPGSHSM